MGQNHLGGGGGGTFEIDTVYLFVDTAIHFPLYIW